MNKLLSFDKSAVTNFSVMANVSIFVPYHNTVEYMTSGGKITVNCVMFIRNRCEKNYTAVDYREPFFRQKYES